MATAAIAFISCNDTHTKESVSDGTLEASHSETHTVHGIIDPVCGMIKDSTWTDFTIYKGDTVWFCAASEKTAFEGNPKKYEKNIK